MKPRGKKSKTLKLEGLVPSLEEDKEAYGGLREKTQAWIHKMGLRLAEQPMKDGQPLQPKLPNLETTPLEKLTQINEELLAYYEYVGTHLSNLKAEKTGLQGRLKLLESKLHVLLPPPEASKKARIIIDERHQNLQLKLDEVEAKIPYLAHLMDTLDKEMNLVSREITVRTADLENLRRNENLRRRGSGGIPGGGRKR